LPAELRLSYDLPVIRFPAKFGKGLPLISGLVLLAAQLSLSQSKSDCLHRTFPVSVLDQNGNVPPNLTNENFKVAYEGRTVDPISVEYTERPRRVLVLLDVSASMEGNGTGDHAKWQTAKVAAAWDFVTTLPPGSMTGLVTFSEKATLEVPLSADRKPVLERLGGPLARPAKSLRGQAIYDALDAAAAQMMPAQPGDAIYLVTDGAENASKARISEVRDLLTSSGIRLFVVIPYVGGPSMEEASGISDLSDASQDSGGFPVTLEVLSLYRGRINSDIAAVSRHASLAITAFYWVTVALPENPNKPQPLILHLTNGNGRNLKDMLFAYPRKIQPCKVEAAQR